MHRISDLHFGPVAPSQRTHTIHDIHPYHMARRLASSGGITFVNPSPQCSITILQPHHVKLFWAGSSEHSLRVIPPGFAVRVTRRSSNTTSPAPSEPARRTHPFGDLTRIGEKQTAASLTIDCIGQGKISNDINVCKWSG
jgi:hypothetical protein